MPDHVCVCVYTHTHTHKEIETVTEVETVTHTLFFAASYVQYNIVMSIYFFN